jgi:hypothetical protein
MLIFFKKNMMLKIACLAVCGLAFFLIACDNVSSDASAITVAAGSSDFSASESSSSTEFAVSSSSKKIFNPDEYGSCNKAREGRYLDYEYSVVTDEMHGIYETRHQYYLCKKGKWEDNHSISDAADIIFIASESFPKCNDDNEGLVDSFVVSTRTVYRAPLFSYTNYYRCEQGDWILRDVLATCDIAGKVDGDTCIRSGMKLDDGSMSYAPTTYFYAGDGTWNALTCPAAMTEKCDSENIGRYEKAIWGNDTYRDTIYCKCDFAGWESVEKYSYDRFAVENSFDPNEFRACDKTLEIDGKYIRKEYDKTCKYLRYGENCDSVSESVYYKCENGKWSIVSDMVYGYDAPDSIWIPSIADVGERFLYDFLKCNVGNEGAVDSLLNPDSKLGAYDYYRCEQGSWTQRSQSLTCDTAGVSVGDTCKKAPYAGASMEMYIYAGNGVWEESSKFHSALPSKTCTIEEENSYVTLVDTIIKVGATPAYETSYYHCETNEWKRVDCLAPEAACTSDAEGKIDSTKGLLPLEARTQEVNSMTCHFTCNAGKWNRTDN